MRSQWRARLPLLVVVGLLAAAVPAVRVQAQQEPAIKWLNPAAYPYTTVTGDPDPPKLSDKHDGIDEAYHLVATTRGAPSGAIVEASIKVGTANEITIGTLSRVGNDTWELFWDIPTPLAKGAATLTARLYAPTSPAPSQIATDSINVDLQHKDDLVQPTDETVELTFPAQNGPIGFYKPRGATAWSTLVDGTASDFSSRVQIFYSIAQPGAAPAFKLCGSLNTFNHANYGEAPIPFSIPCTLAAADRPSQVLAIGAVANEEDEPTHQGPFTQESSDGHRVRPFLQVPRELNITVTPESARRRVGAAGTTADPRCRQFDAVVRDRLGRAVAGVNVDVHLQGPDDQVQFGNVPAAAVGGPTPEGPVSSAHKAPDKDHPAKESGANCASATATQGEQADHNVVAGPDVKHRESTTGTSTSGLWRFHVISRSEVGFSFVTAWIDDEPVASETAARALDDDELEPSENRDRARVQWLRDVITARIDPPSDSAPAGTCNPYNLRVRGGSTPVVDINVDVHATPSDPAAEIHFCDPPGANPRRAPDGGPGGDANPHSEPGDREAKHQANGTRHTEGETDENGDFLFGITSPVGGDTTIEAWVDGETGADNDTRADSEPSAAASKSWFSSSGDAEVRLINPSPYDGQTTDKVSKKRDADETYHLVARVDAPSAIPGVEFLIAPAAPANAPFEPIGAASRVGQSDTYELNWDPALKADGQARPDGQYIVRAQIVDTTKRDDRPVTIQNASTTAFETVEITRPVNAAFASFVNRVTRVEGVASAGTEIVRLFYTRSAAKDAPSWQACGSVTLPGAAAPQSFGGNCTLAVGDRPNQVTGIAARAIDCDPMAGCMTPPGSQTSESGDAHRVFGLEADPVVVVAPAESTAGKDKCHRLVATVHDQANQPIGAANVDVHARGPADSLDFCEPAGGGSERSAPDDGSHVEDPDHPQEAVHSDDAGPDTIHTEGETLPNGKFIFGVSSSVLGDSLVTVWMDENEDDVSNPNESSDDAVVHWRSPGNCTVVGTRGDDVLRGTAAADKICGFGGNDLIYGRGGKDILLGGRGHDGIYAGRGADLVGGGAGRDRLVGGGGSDRIEGRFGDDVLLGGRGGDNLSGGQGSDGIDGGAGRDFCRGGPGADRVRRCER